jgi:PEGA domain
LTPHRWIACTFVLVGTVLLLPSRASAQDNHGKLKVSSFPPGANVSLDGKDTGKVTPMSMEVSVGWHKVAVSIPSSGWNPDVRNVEVAAGKRELSFPRHKRAKEAMLCSVGERPGGPDHWRTWLGGVTAPFEAGSKIASACDFCEAFLGAEEPKNQRGNTFR